MSVNGDLTNKFWLLRSIRQGCPLAPLLYAVVVDGFAWIVKDKTNKGKTNDATLGNGEYVCIEMFANDKIMKGVLHNSRNACIFIVKHPNLSPITLKLE